MEFTLKVTINTTAEKIYKSWLSSEGHTKMTGGTAQISDEVGGKFTAWDGYIEGENMVLTQNKRIVQKWRTSQFETEDEDSQVEIILEELNGKTELTLIHSNLQENGDHYKQGWEDHYFIPMKNYFSEG